MLEHQPPIADLHDAFNSSSYRNPGYKRRNSSYSDHPEQDAGFHRTAGSERVHVDAESGSGRILPGLLQAAECYRR